MSDELSGGDWLYVGERLQVRAVRPGDGFVCAHAAKQRRTPCEAPVAFAQVRTVQSRVDRPSPIAVKSSQCLCPSHLLALFTPHNPSTSGAYQRAVQELLAIHRDEFQTILARHRDLESARHLEEVPQQLRHLVHAAIESETTDV